MQLTKNELLKLNDIICHFNSFTDDVERQVYLKETVEDADLFISILRSVNKNKLITTKKKQEKSNIVSNKFTLDDIHNIFEENTLDHIIATYTKQELTEMYITIYSSKPLSSSNKTRIAQNIYHYFNTINRTKVLLG